MAKNLSGLIDFLKAEAPELETRVVHSGQGGREEKVLYVSSNTQDLNFWTIFFALVGSRVDAHSFIPQALQAQVPIIFIQAGRYEVTGQESAIMVQVKNTTHAYALASAFVNDFSVLTRPLKFIGVTGTNGKTTVTHLIEQLIKAKGDSVGLIGTLGVRHTGHDFEETGHTTPLADSLQSHLLKMVNSQVESVVMEVSSHALEQYRTAMIDFEVGVITNLTQDHLDYHITLEHYAQAKAQLFKQMAKGKPTTSKTAVINVDDPWHPTFIEACPAGVTILRFGIHHPTANIRAKNLRFTIEGTSFDLETPVGEATVHIQLAGEFSVYNALAAIGAGLALQLPLDFIIHTLEQQQGVHGRFEVIHQNPYVIVDYAHTPDGLDNVLKSAKAVLPKGGELITLFGCGGDRDATKRPKMAGIAEKWSNKIVVTSDNPRREDPEQIIADILTGFQHLTPSTLKVIEDRATAIATALDWAKAEDIVVLAGKGHETYQILAHETIDFDDTQVALAHLEKRMKS
ncbi:MAG: UDP-N-acetylmuramoyl-L-alanyl-D-glutamate--2,6-diaminopimelate ligase [Vampirovibrio sp.]